MTEHMDARPCIAGARRDPGAQDGKTWSEGVLWVNIRSKRVFSLKRPKGKSTWQDVTESADAKNLGVAVVGQAYIVDVLRSQPVTTLMTLIDTWL